MPITSVNKGTNELTTPTTEESISDNAIGKSMYGIPLPKIPTMNKGHKSFSLKSLNFLYPIAAVNQKAKAKRREPTS